MRRPAGRDTFSAPIIAQIYTMMTQIIYPAIDVRIRFSLLPSHICVEKQLQFSPLEEWMKGLGYCCSKRRTKGFTAKLATDKKWRLSRVEADQQQ